MADESNFVRGLDDTALVNGSLENLKVLLLERKERDGVGNLAWNGINNRLGSMSAGQERVDLGRGETLVDIESFTISLHVSQGNISTYFCIASSLLIGNPDQMTSSGSTGGMNKVVFSLFKSYTTDESGKSQPVR